MSYQDLRRTPTSTGNQKVFTYSCWLKRNGLSAWARLLSIMDGNTDAIIQLTNVDKLRFRDEITGPDIDYISSRPLRDAGSWMHVLVAIDTTAIQAEHRIRMYINGDSLIEHGLDTESMPGDRDLDLQFNDTGLEHRFFARNLDTEYFLGEAFDLFWVDGQALTPDIFGFNKGGDGYISVGSTQATDFRPGQWVPKSPRTIKSEINRRGGFGVNGFYLPMNDSSNFGADFHCAPNSIIKLKGEDLPQPRNGAPTTTDAYVSQLRQEVGTLGFDGVVKFDGSGDYLTIADNSDFAFGTGDFTVEAFVFATELGTYNTIFDTSSTGQDTTGIRLGVQSNGQLYLYTNGFFLTANNAISTGRWYHIAYVRNSGTHRLFVNGVQLDSTSTARDYTNDSCVIGSHFAFGESWEGFISNLRVVKGTALYTSNFTAPTEPLTNVTNTKLLCCNSSTSATASTVTPGTITANGNASATRNELSGSISLAVPGISIATGSNLITNGSFDSDVSGWGVSGGTFTWNNGRAQHVTTSNVPVYQQITGLTIGQRYTFQYTHYSGYTSAYVSTNTNSGGSILSLGDAVGSSEITKRGSFTATATSHYVIIYGIGSHTSIWDDVVVKQEDAPRDYSADIKGSGTNKTITAYDSAGVGYEIPSYYGSAMNFDGTEDYLATSLSAMGTNDFTIEFWVYPKAISGSYVGPIGLTAATTVKRIELAFQSSSLQIYTDTGTWRNTGFAPPTNQWTHIALEKYNGYLTVYANGVAVWTVTNTRNYDESYNVKIGKHVHTLNGYMQDIRVYNGVAKYKGGFDVSKPYTPVGIESWRQVPDTCKNNFATWNPVDMDGSLVDGNLKASTGTSASRTVGSTFGISSGKYYTEFYINSLTESTVFIGVVNTSASAKDTNLRIYQYNDAVCYSSSNGNKIIDGTSSAYGATYTNGDLIGVSINLDTNEVTFFKNGTSQGTITTKTFTGHYEIMLGSGSSLGAQVVTANFGQNPTFGGTKTAGTYTDSNGRGLFKYQPPTGFLALCEDNLPTPAIADPGEHFKCVLYEGNNVSNGVGRRAVRGVGFKPDLLWIKCRDQAQNHVLYDSVRGLQCLNSNNTAVESTFDSQILGGYDEDGFTTSPNNDSNYNGQSFVAWCWKAGGPAVSNTDGSINSQVSVNRTAGFSIVSYTGNNTNAATVGHGLGKTPAFLITKSRDSTITPAWHTSHVSLAANYDLALDSNDAAWNPSSNGWHELTNSSVFTLKNGTGDGHNVNKSGDRYIAYCWEEMEGYSKFGSYTGNGNSDGPFVYCGFKPAWVMVKCSSAGGRNWRMWDSSRGPTNPNNLDLLANTNNIENQYGSDDIDLLSNGFKIRSTGSWHNTSGETYIFAAFAESPFQTANAK